MTLRQSTPCSAAILAAMLLGSVAAGAAIRDRFQSPWIGYDASIYPQGHVSWAMRSADFNGDGLMDLAVTGWYANPRLTILLADGAGGYLPPAFYPLPLGALDLAAADFDRDGDIDLAIPNTGQYWEGLSFQIWMNQGDGTFFAYGAFPSGQGPNGITINDFNGDGVLDVAVAHDRYISCAASIAIMLGDGAGGFLAPLTVALDSCTYKIDSGDVDGDGDIDLAVAHETNRVTILYNINGQFLVSAVLPGIQTTSIAQYPTVKLSDVDRDGDLDVLYSHSGSGGSYAGQLALFRNPGDGIFGAAEAIDLPIGSEGAIDVDVADIDGDSWPDIIAAQGVSQCWSLVRGDGAGGFGVAEYYRAGETPTAVRASDIDGDGTLDIVVLGRDSLEACVYRNDAGGAFVQPPMIDMADPALAPISYSNLAVADIENDGDLDLVVGYSANFEGVYGISVRRNNGDGTFAARENYALPIFPIRVLLRDMTGDGFVDLVWADDDFPSRFKIRRNNGAGQFATQISGPVLNSVIACIDTADVDADGDLDMLIGAGYGSMLVSRNNAGASFAALQSSPVDGSVTAITSGDFNHDGRIDVIVNTGVQGWAEIMRGNGNGTFQAAVTLETGRAVTALATGDLNNDGNLDFAGVYGLDGTGLTVRRGLGNGTFFDSIEYYGSYSAINDTADALTLADVDGDGVLDALGAFYAAQEIDFWRGIGDGTFEEKVRYGVGRRPSDLAYGDFDGDGTGDIAALVEGEGAGAWYYPGVILLRGKSATPPMPGDVDGDGDVDLTDLALLLSAFGACAGDGGYVAGADFDGSGCVELADLSVLLGNFGS
jgi:hypothetical protein